MSDRALQYSHSGSRYLLGFGEGFFGIWERGADDAPLRRFPRTDAGWHEAWTAYIALEPVHVEVGLRAAATGDGGEGGGGGGGAGNTRSAETSARATGRASLGWWVLPILFGLLGGVIAWAQVRRFDPLAARAMLALGLCETVLAAWLLYG